MKRYESTIPLFLLDSLPYPRSQENLLLARIHACNRNFIRVFVCNDQPYFTYANKSLKEYLNIFTCKYTERFKNTE